MLPMVRSLFVAGVVTGLVAARAGLLAMYPVPAHSEEAHGLMYWHLGIQATAIALFAWPALAKRFDPTAVSGWVATVLLFVGSGIGGYVVYHGGPNGYRSPFGYGGG